MYVILVGAGKGRGGGLDRIVLIRGKIENDGVGASRKAENKSENSASHTSRGRPCPRFRAFGVLLLYCCTAVLLCCGRAFRFFRFVQVVPLERCRDRDRLGLRAQFGGEAGSEGGGSGEGRERHCEVVYILTLGTEKGYRRRVSCT